MRTLSLPGTGRLTSQLGFGGSALMGAAGRRESLALLEYAFDTGIRHFDVAPMYGYGAAEGCLGEFLARHPGQVTVTTKYGIAPPPKQGLLRAVRRAAGPALGLFPGIRKRLAGAANSVVALAPKAAFTAPACRASLDHSLRELRTERIDLFLLHEAEAEDLTDDGLLRFLEDAVAQGKIGAFGCGSNASSVPALLLQRPEYCPALQFEWSILDKPLGLVPAFTLHHRALTANFAELRSALQRDTSLCWRWSEETGADLAKPGVLAGLMLKAALTENPESIILVSSRNRGHIAENVRVASNDEITAAARKLYVLAQRDGAAALVKQ